MIGGRVSVGRGGVRRRGVWSLFAAALLASCAPQPRTAQTVTTPTPFANITSIKINGVPYPTVDAALAARQRFSDAFVAKLSRETDPLKGRALIVIPDHDRLRPLIEQRERALLKRPVTGAALNFFISEEQQNLRELADSLVRNGTFQSITVEERNDVLFPGNGDNDFVVWFQVRTLLPNNIGVWLGNWMVRHAGSNATLGASVDPGTPVGAPRLASFVKSVHDDALRLGGDTVSGKTAADLPGPNGLPVATSGSGIVVDRTGDIVTNAHVVAACTGPTVIDASGVRYHARVVTKDGANDLALLKTDHRWPEAASFRDGGELRAGDNVIATGYPLTGLVASSMAVTAGTINAIAGPRDDTRLFQLSAPVQPGNSGGPVLDLDGHVVGMVTSELNGALLTLFTGIAPQNVNFAIKSAILRNFLESQSVDFAHASSTAELSSARIATLARSFTVRIDCGHR